MISSETSDLIAWIWVAPMPFLALAGTVWAAREKARHPHYDGFGLFMVAAIGTVLWGAVIVAFLGWALWSMLVAAFTPAVSPVRDQDPSVEDEGLPRVEPLTDDDPFCSCPSCGLVGNHAVERDVFRTPKYDDGHGDVIEVVCAAMLPDGTPVTKRTCVFCQHAWSRSRQEVAS